MVEDEDAARLPNVAADGEDDCPSGPNAGPDALPSTVTGQPVRSPERSSAVISLSLVEARHVSLADRERAVRDAVGRNAPTLAAARLDPR